MIIVEKIHYNYNNKNKKQSKDTLITDRITMKRDTMDRTFFAGVKSEETALCFFDLSMIKANFPVPAAKVQETLPSNKLKTSPDYARYSSSFPGGHGIPAH